MGADKRTYNLTAITAEELKQLLSSISLDVDDESLAEAEAKKLKLDMLLSNDIVTNSDINYRALTPAGFNKSTMTNERYGVGKHATPDEVNKGEGDGLIRAADLPIIFTNSVAQIFKRSGVNENYAYRNNEDTAYAWDVCLDWTSAGQYSYINLSPAGKVFDYAILHIVVRSGGYRYGGVPILINGGNAWTMGSIACIKIEGGIIRFYHNYHTGGRYFISAHINAIG